MSQTDYIDYAQMSALRRLAYRGGRAVRGLPRTLGDIGRRIAAAVTGWFRRMGAFCAEIGRAARHGDAATRASFAVMGVGSMAHRQVVRGALYLVSEVLFVLYLVFFGGAYLAKIGTLGTATAGEHWNEELQIYEYTAGDNSMQILLFSVLTLFVIGVFAVLYFSNIRAAWRTQRMIEEGQRPSSFREDIHALRDRSFHTTLLTAPTVMVTLFTVLPLLFMVLIAFTNFDKTHQPPGNLFTWVGWQNFKDIFWENPLKSYTFGNLLVWTLVWAALATFSNYILGMILALMINKKGIRLKKMWRTLFIVTIAVPQFVGLLIMSQILQEQGVLNVLLQEWGLTGSPLPFLSDGTWAKVTVILVNMWVGVPYTILITSGILMNIPEDLYESARIDGAGPVRTFMKITLPYMLFVTTPYLITQFVGNINNFNVIYFLTGGGPLTLDYYQAGKTDLLVTWLYKQTVEQQNYNLAATIGIMVFLVSAVFSLIVYNSTASSRKEDQFQ